MPKFQAGDKVRVSEDNHCRTLIRHGKPRTGVVISYAGPQAPATFVAQGGTITGPSVLHYLVKMDEGAEESIPERCLESL